MVEVDGKVLEGVVVVVGSVAVAVAVAVDE
jgi:hypothetical protein